MKKTGFLKLYHSMLKWEWYSDIKVSRLFLHCLLKSTYKDVTWRGINISRGSFISSLLNLSKETGLSIQEVRTALKKLEKTHEIIVDHNVRYTLIKIVKYNHYQHSDKKQSIEEKMEI